MKSYDTKNKISSVVPATVPKVDSEQKDVKSTSVITDTKELDILYQLGNQLLSGAGIEKDIEQAAKKLGDAFKGGLESARTQYHTACRLLEDSYLLGNEGKKKDLSQAFFWLKKRAALEDSQALFDLGVAYYQGKYRIQDEQPLEVGRDLKKADLYFKRAKDNFGKYSIFDYADELEADIAKYSEKIRKKIKSTPAIKPALKASVLKPKPKENNKNKHLESVEKAKKLKEINQKDDAQKAAALKLQQEQNEEGKKLKAYNNRPRNNKTFPVTSLTQQPAPVASTISDAVVPAVTLNANKSSSTAVPHTLAEVLPLDDKDDVKLNLACANDFYLKDDYISALIPLTKAAQKNSIQAYRDLAVIYHVGIGGVKINLKLSAEWYEKAAKLNDAQAQFIYSNLLYWGIGVNQDFKQSYAWLVKAYQTADKDTLNTIYHTALGFKDKQATTLDIQYMQKLSVCAAQTGHVHLKEQLDLILVALNVKVDSLPLKDNVNPEIKDQKTVSLNYEKGSPAPGFFSHPNNNANNPSSNHSDHKYSAQSPTNLLHMPT